MKFYRRLGFMGFPLHRVGRDGSVWTRSTKRGNNAGFWTRMKPRILNKNRPDKKPYYRIGLARNKKRKMFLVHRLVLMAFVGPCPPGMEGCHNDNHSFNNWVDNLRWDTPIGNQRDRLKHGTSNRGRSINIGETNGHAQLDRVKVKRIRQDHKAGLGGYKTLGLKYHVHWSTIRAVVKGHTWSHVQLSAPTRP